MTCILHLSGNSISIVLPGSCVPEESSFIRTGEKTAANSPFVPVAAMGLLLTEWQVSKSFCVLQDHNLHSSPLRTELHFLDKRNY